ncbi:hypothetical protein [Erwinia tracheiphila]|uniref:Uncharacterized protein n=1 Tax=Erwinia tracheiphila TaxID=65700 RepID=A0A0M2KFY2_9GAMM|nr:hypothetical protein [Erwinia tracheiphila]KKF35856.1 hypothetical protein SY86_11120 [Erwinia tracheiphila]
MTDFYAFIDWLWGRDPRLAVRTQDYHDSWHKLLTHHHESQQETIADNALLMAATGSSLKSTDWRFTA